MVYNDRDKILWDLLIQMNKLVMANQPDIVLVDKQRKKAIVLDVAIPGMWMVLVIPTRKQGHNLPLLSTFLSL